MLINIFTDGACSGNPGPGGFCTILEYNGKEKVITNGFRKTTNNRMELLSVIEGLRSIKRYNIPIVIYSDSKYVVDSVQKGWLSNWIKSGFKGKKNVDLWKDFQFEYSKFNDVKFIWIKGHNGHSMNERCDLLAVSASKSSTKLIDFEYEKINP